MTNPNLTLLLMNASVVVVSSCNLAYDVQLTGFNPLCKRHPYGTAA